MQVMHQWLPLQQDGGCACWNSLELCMAACTVSFSRLSILLIWSQSAYLELKIQSGIAHSLIWLCMRARSCGTAANHSSGQLYLLFMEARHALYQLCILPGCAQALHCNHDCNQRVHLLLLHPDVMIERLICVCICRPWHSPTTQSCQRPWRSGLSRSWPSCSPVTWRSSRRLTPYGRTPSG